jgi:hypothetical protein
MRHPALLNDSNSYALKAVFPLPFYGTCKPRARPRLKFDDAP